MAIPSGSGTEVLKRTGIRNMINIKFDDAAKYRILGPARTTKNDAGGAR